MNDDSTTVFAAATTRRTVVKTGVKLAYTAPLVAASFKLTAGGASATSHLGGTCTGANVCGEHAECDDPELFCGCFFTAEGDSFCVADGGCGDTCVTTADCTIAGQRCVASCCEGLTCQYACGDPRADVVFDS